MDPQPIWTLSSFPVEVLQPITSLLHGKEIGFLWLTGNTRLRSSLANGGVTQFEMNRVIDFPALIRHFRLTHLDLSVSPLNLECTYLFTRNVDLRLLPLSLRSLRLHLPNALHRVCRLPADANLAALVPSLTELMFSPQIINPFDDIGFLDSIPKTLKRLELPENVSFSIASLEHLPPTLTHLSIMFALVLLGQEPRIREAAALQELATFHIILFPNVRWPYALPSSVTDCKVAYVQFLPSSPAQNYRAPLPLPNEWNLDDDALLALPRSLTRLIMPGDGGPNRVDFELLPKTLVELAIPRKWWKRVESLTQHLPRLSTLRTGVHENPVSMPKLPTSLTRLYGVSFTFPSKEYAIEYGKQFLDGANPLSCIKTLDAAELHPHQVVFVPEHLTVLSIFEVKLRKDSLAILLGKLKELKQLDLRFDSHLDLRDIQPLPPLLESLRLHLIYPLNDSFDLDWSAFWPKKLRELDLRMGTKKFKPNTYHSDPRVLSSACERFWASLPQTLTSMWLRLRHLPLYPTDLKKLPRRLLQTLELNCTGLNYVTLTDESLVSLPPSLTAAYFMGFGCITTAGVLPKLPRALNTLVVVPTHSDAPNIFFKRRHDHPPWKVIENMAPRLLNMKDYLTEAPTEFRDFMMARQEQDFLHEYGGES